MSTHPCPFCLREFSDGARLRKHFSNSPSCNNARQRDLERMVGNARRNPDGLDPGSPIVVDESHFQLPRRSKASPVPMEVGNESAEEADDAHARHNGAEPVQVGTPLEMDIDDANGPASGEDVLEAPRFRRRERHGYACVEVHENAARVIRWEYEDNQNRPGPTDVLRQRDWFNLGEWLAKLPIKNSQRAEYFNIKRHVEGSPWQSLKDFQASIDQLDRGPPWVEDTVTVTTPEGSETFTLLKRCPLALVRHLIGLTRLRDHMCYAPETHTVTTFNGQRIRVYSEMWTGEWWARLQGLLGEGVTIAPFIIATDETNLTKLSGSKVAWPVYGTIGNIRKAVRRRPSEHATMLLGYIPVAKLTWITNLEERRKRKWELYHASLAKILEPLKTASRDGIEMRCADGGVRRVHPVLAAHIGDWPEQATAGCTSLTRCPVCIAPFRDRGNLGPAAPLRTKSQSLWAIELARRGYSGMQVGLGLRSVVPYWSDHPWSSGPASFQPDLLHQLWKGVFLVHLLPWWTKIIGSAEMDRRYIGLPRVTGRQYFSGGLSPLSQWTGNQARATARSFLPIVASHPVPQAVRAARCIINFTYRARMPQLDEDDLRQLDRDLDEFHKNKAIFRTQGAQNSQYGFNAISKLHVIRHYPHSIREMGTPDNYSTEMSERLHIDFVKVPYEHSNHVHPEPQMTTYLEEQEAWSRRRFELEDDGVIEKKKRRARAEEEPIDNWATTNRKLNTAQEYEDEGADEYGKLGERAEGTIGSHRGLWVVANGDEEPRGDQLIPQKEHEAYHFKPTLKMGIRPLFPRLAGTDLIRYRDDQFITLTHDYIASVDRHLAFQVDEHSFFGVWSQFTLSHDYLLFAPLVGRHTEVIHASPAYYNAAGHVTKPRLFDTVLLDEFPDRQGILRYRAARVRLIFRLPRHCLKTIPEPLALVELFEPFNPNVSAVHQLVTVKPWIRSKKRVRRVVPVSTICSSCELVPQYSALRSTIGITPNSDLLATAPRFFLNPTSNNYFFSVMDHWRRLMWR